MSFLNYCKDLMKLSKRLLKNMIVNLIIEDILKEVLNLRKGYISSYMNLLKHMEKKLMNINGWNFLTCLHVECIYLEITFFKR